MTLSAAQLSAFLDSHSEAIVAELTAVRGSSPREETPHRTPLWLLLLRLAIAALLILALAGPLLNARPPMAGAGPLLIVVDNGWASAPRWEARAAAMRDLVAEAGRAERPVALLGPVVRRGS